MPPPSTRGDERPGGRRPHGSARDARERAVFERVRERRRRVLERAGQARLDAAEKGGTLAGAMSPRPGPRGPGAGLREVLTRVGRVEPQRRWIGPAMPPCPRWGLRRHHARPPRSGGRPGGASADPGYVMRPRAHRPGRPAAARRRPSPPPARPRADPEGGPHGGLPADRRGVEARATPSVTHGAGFPARVPPRHQGSDRLSGPVGCRRCDRRMCRGGRPRGSCYCEGTGARWRHTNGGAMAAPICCRHTESRSILWSRAA